MAEILPIRRKTLSNQSINQDIKKKSNNHELHYKPTRQKQISVHFKILMIPLDETDIIAKCMFI